jgi:hypothetical protein
MTENTHEATAPSPLITYGKFIVAILGVAVTTLLGIVAPDTDLWKVLTVASAVLTAIGVYAAPAITNRR